jgi:hypothetical protein
LREQVEQALRMGPSRLVVGEVRAEECLDLLLALNAGLPAVATLHANSAREALMKMCTPLLAGDNSGVWRASRLGGRTGAEDEQRAPAHRRGTTPTAAEVNGPCSASTPGHLGQVPSGMPAV